MTSAENIGSAISITPFDEFPLRQPSQKFRFSLTHTLDYLQDYPSHPLSFHLEGCLQHDKCNRGKRMRCCNYNVDGRTLFSAMMEPWGYVLDKTRQCIWFYDQNSKEIPVPHRDTQLLLIRPFRHHMWILEGPRKPTDELRILGSLDFTKTRHRQYLYDLRFADLPTRQTLLRDLPGRLSLSHRPPQFLFKGVASSQMKYALPSKEPASSAEDSASSQKGIESTRENVTSPEVRHDRKVRARIARDTKADSDLRRHVLVDCANTRSLPSRPQTDKSGAPDNHGTADELEDLDKSDESDKTGGSDGPASSEDPDKMEISHPDPSTAASTDVPSERQPPS